jgi:non-heme chloroperoxidase
MVRRPIDCAGGRGDVAAMRRRRLLLTALTATIALAGAGDAAAGGDGHRHRSAASIDLQERFDHIGAQVHSLATRPGRTSYYIDEGRPGWTPVVFIGGAGTSLEAFQLTEFARSSREELRVRVISVERNGFGESALDTSLGYADYNAEIFAVLDHLGIDRFAIMAISGGGAYAAQLAAAAGSRVRSLHIAAAVASTLPGRTVPRACTRTVEELNAANIAFTHFPKVWWGVAPDSPVHAVPGWQAEAYLDAARSFFVGGQLGAPDALTHEQRLPCGPDAVVDPARITAPAYLYWGELDTSVPPSVMTVWQAALGSKVARATIYPGEGHTVQYRHWDQTLADIAGFGDHTVVCTRGRTRLVPERSAARLLARGASLGLCAWPA